MQGLLLCLKNIQFPQNKKGKEEGIFKNNIAILNFFKLVPEVDTQPGLLIYVKYNF